MLHWLLISYISMNTNVRSANVCTHKNWKPSYKPKPHISWDPLNHWPHHICWKSVCNSDVWSRQQGKKGHLVNSFVLQPPIYRSHHRYNLYCQKVLPIWHFRLAQVLVYIVARWQSTLTNYKGNIPLSQIGRLWMGPNHYMVKYEWMLIYKRLLY